MWNETAMRETLSRENDGTIIWDWFDRGIHQATLQANRSRMSAMREYEGYLVNYAKATTLVDTALKHYNRDHRTKVAIRKPHISHGVVTYLGEDGAGLFLNLLRKRLISIGVQPRAMIHVRLEFLASAFISASSVPSFEGVYNRSCVNIPNTSLRRSHRAVDKTQFYSRYWRQDNVMIENGESSWVTSTSNNVIPLWFAKTIISVRVNVKQEELSRCGDHLLKELHGAVVPHFRTSFDSFNTIPSLLSRSSKLTRSTNVLIAWEIYGIARREKLVCWLPQKNTGMYT